MDERRDTDRDDGGQCDHDYIAEYDGEGIWATYRGTFCMHCGELAPEREEE